MKVTKKTAAWDYIAELKAIEAAVMAELDEDADDSAYAFLADLAVKAKGPNDGKVEMGDYLDDE